MSRSNYPALINENPIIFTPDAACLIGVTCAIIAQKLQFLIKCPDCGKETNGDKWIYNSYEQWQEKYFPFFSVETIKNSFRDLETWGIVASIQPEGRESRRKHYRITDAGMTILDAKHLLENRWERPKRYKIPVHCEGVQNTCTEGVQNTRSCAGASKHSENTTESPDVSFQKLELKLPEAKNSDLENQSNLNTSSPRTPPCGGPPPKKRVSSQSQQGSEEGMKFASWHREELCLTQNLQSGWQKAWAINYDAMIRIDGRTKEQIIAVCRWAKADDFWGQNYMSPLKLRKRNREGIQYFDVFLNQMTSQKKTTDGRNAAGIRTI